MKGTVGDVLQDEARALVGAGEAQHVLRFEAVTGELGLHGLADRADLHEARIWKALPEGARTVRW